MISKQVPMSSYHYEFHGKLVASYCYMYNHYLMCYDIDSHKNILFTEVILFLENQTIATGQPIILECIVNGIYVNNLTYQWTKSSPLKRLNVVNDSSNMLFIHNASVNDSGIYNCGVFDTSDNSTVVKSNSINVTVLGK